jgi:hypothetical protein
MKIAALAKTAQTFSTGFGLKEYLKKHKTAAGLIIALVIANEIRGLMVVGAIVKAWWS